MTTERKGFLAGLAAYGLWGVFPIYWRALAPVGPLELLGHRIIWASVAVGIFILAARRWREVRAVLSNRRTTLIMTGASITIGINWGLFIWGVNNGYIVEVALGYFINPLMSIVIGVVLFKEKLRRWQWVAIGIAVAGVIVLAIDYGRPPWIALALAVSFATYGTLKKLTPVAPMPGLLVETLVLLPFAAAILLVVGLHGSAEFGQHGWLNTTLILTVGIATAIPLLLFAVAAQSIPLTTVGLLQYITPTGQLLIGVLLYHEAMPVGRWIGFSIVWLALAVFTVDALVIATRNRVPGTSAQMTKNELLAVSPEPT